VRPAAHEWLRPPQGTPDIPRGTVVRDLVTGLVGVLQDVTPYAEPRPEPLPSSVQLLAFLRPVGGGREWTTTPDQLVPEPRAPSALSEERVV
jgi:hypothetical protein